MKTVPSTEERIWAVFSHLSVMVLGMGIFLPVIAWSQQRKKSSYASFQSLQALGYQSLWYTVWILLTFVIVIIQSLGTFAKLLAAADSGADIGSLTAMVMGGHFTVMFVLMAFYLIPPLIAVVACALGKDFRYPLMGNRLANYLGYSTDEASLLVEEHEERWVVAMGHFSVIIMLWGMLAPLTTWVMEGKHSLFLRFQALQTLTFQALTLILYFVAGVFYVGGMMFFLLSLGVSGAPSLDSSMGIAGGIVFLTSMLCVLGVILIVPLLHIMGQWAGYRILKGDMYRYPLIGKWVEKRIK